jgi:hypothetical protein
MTVHKRGCYIPVGSRLDALRFKACTSKRRFATRRHAQECQPLQKAYQCDYCGYWHLTSQTGKAGKKRRYA